VLTAGQAGGAPQAMPLIKGLPAEIVMAGTAYDSGALRGVIAAKGATRQHSQPSAAGEEISAQQGNLRRTPSDRMLFLETETVPACDGPL
jgi:hypothetical protein